jgi:ABC-type glycerol-3-phosphate transport system substrate-binding protein
VGVYFGFASEYAGIAARNPNLSFATAVLPQPAGNSAHLTYGLMTGVALSRTAPNAKGAVVVAEHLTDQATIAALAQKLFLPPVRTDVAIDTSNNAAADTFIKSSLIARGWLDPNPSATDAMFQTMVTEVLSGANEPAGAIAEGSQVLSRIFSQPH